MKIKNNKGITGIDITVAIVILALFISLITSMFYNVSVIGKAVNRKSDATYIAVQVIEGAKQLEYDKLPKGYVEESDLEEQTEEEAEAANTTINFDDLNTLLEENGITAITLKNGYSVDIIVENYRKIKGDLTLEDILKRITVTVNYKEKNKEQSVELNTVILKEEE